MCKYITNIQIKRVSFNAPEQLHMLTSFFPSCSLRSGLGVLAEEAFEYSL